MVTSCSRDKVSADTPVYMWLPPMILPQLYSKIPIFITAVFFGDSVGLSPAPGVGDRAAIRSARQETSGYRLTVPGTHHPGGRSMLNHRSDPIQPECLAGPRMTTKFNAQAPRPPRTGVRWHRPPRRLGRPV